MIIADALGTDPRIVHTVLPGDTIADTVDLLAEFGIGAVVVTTDGRTIEGIISERDVVRYLAHEQEGTLRIKVEDLMTRNVITCRREDSLEAIARQMLDGRFRHMPVADDDGGLIAMVSLGDLMDTRLRASVA
ncbi:MAG: CBS domain-containing protein [Actinomycetota bacterium]